MKDFENQLKEVMNFITQLKENYFINDVFTKDKENFVKMTKTEGKRYVKLINNASVYCFIDKTNGDILKAESWTKPAKHARGNIFKPEEWEKNLEKYGPRYLR